MLHTMGEEFLNSFFCQTCRWRERASSAFYLRALFIPDGASDIHQCYNYDVTYRSLSSFFELLLTKALHKLTSQLFGVKRLRAAGFRLKKRCEPRPARHCVRRTSFRSHFYFSVI